MAQTSFYTEKELATLGLKSYGKNVYISRKASIYGAGNIEIGDNVRIDDFCTLSISNHLKIGSFVHIGCYASIIGAGEIVLSDFSGLSGRVSIYSSSDDYTGEYLTNPMVPDEYTNVTSDDVYIGRHVVVGCGSVILPGVAIGDGASIGAMTLVQKNCQAGYIYAGNPMKKLIKRFDNYLVLEKQLINNLNKE